MRYLSKTLFCGMMFCAGGLALSSPTVSNGDVQQLNGVWLGRSLFVTSKPACSDETVQYRIRVSEKQAISIAADKWVHDKYEWMGDIQCSFESLRQLIRCPMGDNLWLFRWDGQQLVGQLMVAHDGVFRHVFVSKSS